MIPATEQYQLVIGLPAFNEEQNLPALLHDIQAADLADCLVLVVDDGSTDRTAAIATEWAEKMPLHLHRHERNLGLGAAIRHIYELARPRLRDDGVLITLDADGSHRPEQIPEMVAKVREGCDLVIASRYTAASRVTGVPALRRLLSYGAYLAVRLLLGVREVRDFTCGFRAVSADLLRRAEEKYPEGLATESGFAVTVEVLIKLLHLGARPAEIGMDLRYDLKRGASKIRIGHTIMQYLRLFRRLRRKA
ncbi:MAG: glycosyltransferase family 2 protein [Alphaproteobacteria bacterium]